MSEGSQPAPRWASIKEAHAYSRIPKPTLRRWIAKGLLPASRVGPRRIEVDLNEIDKLRKPITSPPNQENPA